MHPFKIMMGLFFISIGLFFIFLYSNLLTLGYSFWEFVQFISKKVECLFFLIGLLFLFYGMGGSIKNVLLLRHSFKFWK